MIIRSYLLLLLVVLGTSCQETVKLGYDETINDPILEANLSESPKENVGKYLADAGVTAETITIYSSPEKNCECAKKGMDCYCKLGNSGLSSHSCGDAEEACKKPKYIEVEVAAGDAGKLSSKGFNEIDAGE